MVLLGPGLANPIALKVRATRRPLLTLHLLLALTPPPPPGPGPCFAAAVGILASVFISYIWYKSRQRRLAAAGGKGGRSGPGLNKGLEFDPAEPDSMTQATTKVFLTGCVTCTALQHACSCACFHVLAAGSTCCLLFLAWLQQWAPGLSTAAETAAPTTTGATIKGACLVAGHKGLAYPALGLSVSCPGV